MARKFPDYCTIHICICVQCIAYHLCIHFNSFRGAAIATALGSFSLFISIVIYVFFRKPTNMTWQGLISGALLFVQFVLSDNTHQLQTKANTKPLTTN